MDRHDMGRMCSIWSLSLFYNRLTTVKCPILSMPRGHVFHAIGNFVNRPEKQFFVFLTDNESSENKKVVSSSNRKQERREEIETDHLTNIYHIPGLT